MLRFGAGSDYYLEKGLYSTESNLFSALFNLQGHDGWYENCDTSNHYSHCNTTFRIKEYVVDGKNITKAAIDFVF